MKHHGLLTYCCEQAQKDLRTGYGVGYSGEPIQVEVLSFPVVDDPGAYQVCAKFNNRVGVLAHPGDEFLENLLNNPERVENYVSILRENAWKWAHSEEARCTGGQSGASVSTALAVGMLVVLKDAPGRPTGTIEKMNSRSAWVWWHRNGETTRKKLTELKSIHSGPDTEAH